MTPELLKAKRLIRSIRIDVKILGQGDLTTKLSVSAHGFSKSAREKIEGAGGTITWLRSEPVPKVKKQRKRPAPAADEPSEETEETTAEAEVEPESEDESSEPAEGADA